MKGSVLALAAASLVSLPYLAEAAVINGDFEDTSSSTPANGLINGNALSDLGSGSGAGSWDVYTAIPGWTTVGGAGIEVQSNATLSSLNAQSGSHYVELDSHGGGNSNSQMSQQLFLTAGSYDLRFFYSPRNGNQASNGIDFWIDTLFSGGVIGPDAGQGTQVGQWTEFVVPFKVAAAGSYSLFFAATGTQDTYGGFLDTISIDTVAVPVPASLVLLAGGLGCLGFVRRRRRG